MIHGLSLFSNVGIAELLLKESGIDIVVANELESNRAKFYKHVYPHCDMVVGDIYDKYNEIIHKAKQNNCKFLMATPPCQGMSLAGKKDKSDHRNALIIPVLDAIKDLDPDYVLIENVPQILKLIINYNGDKDSVENIISKQFGDKYYINKQKVLNTQDYGIPQSRKRAIILLSKHNAWEFPTKSPKLVTVQEVIGDLPSVEAIVEGNSNYFKDNDKKIQKCLSVSKWHTPKEHILRHIEIMRHTPSGKTAFENEKHYPKKECGSRIRGYNTTYKRIAWDKPAPTITMANGSISSQNNVHPGRLLEDGTYSDARVLTIYEIMKLSTIPDDWNVPTDVSENFIRQVIGEGIPPRLIQKITSNIDHRK